MFCREYLINNRFTEIINSKILSSGTEGGTNLFELGDFDRVAYLAQSPQFYKEHGVAGFERVFETYHVYRPEPQATSRHLTESYSLDIDFGFIDGPEYVIQLERESLTYIFNPLNQQSPAAVRDYVAEKDRTKLCAVVELIRITSNVISKCLTWECRLTEDLLLDLRD